MERAIGLLKGRWKKLLFLDHMDLQLTVHLIISACVLHNFCIIHDDFYDGDFGDDPHDNGNQPDERAEQKKDPSDEHYLYISNSSLITQAE